MADLATHLEQIDSGQAANAVTANNLIDALSPASYAGRHAEACVGLTWGYYGGRWGGTLVADGTLALSASAAAVYVVVHRTTGALSAATASTNWTDTDTYGRAYKVTTGASSVTDYEDHRTGPGGIFAAGAGGGGSSPTDYPVAIQVACSDLATAIAAGNGKAVFRMPHAMTLTAVRASLATAQASGSIFTVDVNEAGASVLSTKLTIDNTEKTSTTAATAAVISDASLADDAEITIDVDQIGNGTAKGLVVSLIGTRPA